DLQRAHANATERLEVGYSGSDIPRLRQYFAEAKAVLESRGRERSGAGCLHLPRVLAYPPPAGPLAPTLASPGGPVSVSRTLLLVPLSLALAACVRTKSVLVDPSAPPLPARDPANVRIFTSSEELDTLAYTRVALIEATASGELTSQSGMLQAMRKKAAKLGANGILLPSINEPGAGAKVAGAVFGTGTQRKGNVVAIRITGRR
ncbi:MAG: hypothetical protein ACK55A_02930, partial [Gemmatimonas sp.]